MARFGVLGISFDHMHMGDLLRQVADHPEAEIAGIYDPDPARMQAAIANFAIPPERVFTDLDGSGAVNLSEEHGVNNVLVSLTGTDAHGNTVSGSTRTLADGTYTFGLLPPGTTYSVSYTPPTLTPAYVDASTGKLTISFVEPVLSGGKPWPWWAPTCTWTRW